MLRFLIVLLISGKFATACERLLLFTLLLLRLPFVPLKLRALLALYLCENQRFVRSELHILTVGWCAASVGS